MHRAYEQNTVSVQKWLDGQRSAIAAIGETQNAEIHWGDKIGLFSYNQHGRSYASKGQTPAIRLCAKKDRRNLISSVTNQGKVRFMNYKDSMNAQMMIKFMQRLIRDGIKNFLILDSLRVHHSHVIKGWGREQYDKIEYFFCYPTARSRIRMNTLTET